MGEQKGLRAPIIVLDWNLIQTMPASKEIPPHFQCVIPAQAIHEIATKESGSNEAALRKFVQWGSRNVGRLWIGRLPEYLFEQQMRSKGKRLRMYDVIEPTQTRIWRRALRSPQVDWAKSLAHLKNSPPINLRNHQIAELVRFSDAIKDAWKKRPLKRLPQPTEKGEWIRLPQFATDLVEYVLSSRWRKEWRRYLDDDANRFAIIRWARFLAWYCVKRAEGQTKKFENNFDDIHYGLLASYTGHLGTNDKGLQEATVAIFPGLRVIRLENLQSYKRAG
jgi:hypothetical protein